MAVGGLVRVKICGVTHPDDAEAAEAAGADAIGVILHAASARRIDVAIAEEVLAPLGPFVQRVGVFVDAPAGFVRTALERLRLDVLQFHGSETAEYVADFRLRARCVKAVRYRRDLDLDSLAAFPADALLVDGPRPGSGERFEWEHAQVLSALSRWVLAGGLTVESVPAAIRRLAPYGVDVATGVEGASKGRKDHELVRRFVAAAKSAR